MLQAVTCGTRAPAEAAVQCMRCESVGRMANSQQGGQHHACWSGAVVVQLERLSLLTPVHNALACVAMAAYLQWPLTSTLDSISMACSTCWSTQLQLAAPLLPGAR